MTEKIYIRKLRGYADAVPYKWMICKEPAYDFTDDAYIDMYSTWEKALICALDIQNGN